VSSRAIVLTLLATGLIGGGLIAGLLPEPVRKQGVDWLAEPRPLPAFTLQSGRAAFSQDQLRDRWTLLSIGYLGCADVCPTTLSQLSQLEQALNDSLLQVLFVSIDPGRDLPAEVVSYVDYFNPRFLGATAGVADLQVLVAGLGMQFTAGMGEADYALAHSTAIALIGPQGHLRGRLWPGYDLPTVVAELRAGFHEH
jgi:protein SCO1/2